VDSNTYLVGRWRLNLNHKQLMPNAKKALADSGIQLRQNPHKSLIKCAIELVHFYGIKLVNEYKPTGPRMLVKTKARRFRRHRSPRDFSIATRSMATA
jgi:hypothetical protein